MTARRSNIGAFAMLVLGIALVIGGGYLYTENVGARADEDAGLSAFVGISVLALGSLPLVIGLMMLGRRN